METGQQVAYIPEHAEGNREHPDVEFGFVTSSPKGKRYSFCRYWIRGKPGQLRTTNCSELTGNSSLVKHVCVPQAIVDKFIKEIEDGRY